MGIPQILAKPKTVAVVGISDKRDRASYQVAEYLLDKGFRIIPVNPNIKVWKGMRAYPSLSEVEGSVDIVDIFRKSESVPGIVKEAIRIGAKIIWMQLGIVNDEAARTARNAGLEVVMDRCMRIEHMRLARKGLKAVDEE